MSAEHPSRGDIAGLAMLASVSSGGADSELARFESHAASCASCTAEWRRASKLASLMGQLATPPPASEKSLARTQARVHALLISSRTPVKTEIRSPLAGYAVAASVLVSVVVALAMLGPSISASRTLLAITTIGVAALLPSYALRSDTRAKIATASALLLSFLLAFVDYSVVPMIAGHAVGCLSMELMVGALPLVSMLGFARANGPSLGAWQTGAAGACGALAGQGVLLTTCAADESVLHVLAFHVLGVVVATLLGLGLGRVVSRA